MLAPNPDYQTGIASSLRVGLAATPAEARGAVVLLGDMPNVSARLIDDLIDAFVSQPSARAVAPIEGGRPGNPILLTRRLFDDAMRLDGDEGARRLLAALDPREIVEIIATEWDVTLDIDIPDNLEAARRGQR